MTVDLTIAPADLSASCRRQVAALTGPNPYATGGETVTPTDFRMGKVFVILGSISNGTVLLLAHYDVATGKLIWFDNATGNEVVNGSDLSTYTGRVEVIGQ